MNHFYQTIGGGVFSYEEFYVWAARELGQGETAWVVEVGCFTGQSAAFLAVELKNVFGGNVCIDLVDTFQYCAPEHVRKNLEPVEDVIGDLHVGLSWEVASLYGDRSLDLVFVDAGHSYGDVCKDIDAWLPKVKIGGLIAGHDYVEWPGFGVIRAVNERFARFNVWPGHRNLTDANMLAAYWPCWCVRVGEDTLQKSRERVGGDRKANGRHLAEGVRVSKYARGTST